MCLCPAPPGLAGCVCEMMPNSRRNVGVSVCLSGAAIRGGRGGAARLSYRVCSSARPSARPPAGLGHAGCCRWGMCLSLLPWLVGTHPDPLYPGNRYGLVRGTQNSWQWIPWIRAQALGPRPKVSMEFMEINGIYAIPWIPWNPWTSWTSMASMDSIDFMDFNGIHGDPLIPCISWNP